MTPIEFQVCIDPVFDRTFGYQQRSFQTAVLRRGQSFFIGVRMKDRNFDPRRDIMRVCFNFGIVFFLFFYIHTFPIIKSYTNLFMCRPDPAGDQGNPSCFAVPSEPARVHPCPAKVGYPYAPTRGIQHDLPSSYSSQRFGRSMARQHRNDDHDSGRSCWQLPVQGWHVHSV